MANRLFNFFLPENNTLSAASRKKLRYLLILDFILVIFFSLMAFVRLVVAFQLWTGLGVALFAVVSVSALIFIKLGRYNLSVLLSLTSCMLCSNAIVYTTPGTHYLDIYKLGFFLLATIYVACLISFKVRTIVIFGLLNCVSLVVFFIFKVLPLQTAGGTNDHLAAAVAVLAVMIIATVLAYFLVSMSTSLIASAETEAKKNGERFAQLQGVMNSSKQSFLVGEHLIDSTGKTIGCVRDIHDRLINIKNKISILNGEIAVITESNREVNDAAGRVRNIVTDQNASLEQSTISVNGMAEAMNKVAGLSRERKQTILDLVETAKNGESKMVESAEAMERISASAGEMLEVVDVIVQVAKQTSLLAMNASIEAAHAGQYGRGFAVVADEIRKLSEETDTSTREITDKLRNNQVLTGNARDINVAARTIFESITRGVHDVLAAMDEILSQFESLSKESLDIIGSMSNLARLSKGTGGSIGDVAVKIGKSDGVTKNVSAMAAEILTTIERILESFNDIANEVTAVDEIGKENIKNIGLLEAEINNIT